MCVLPWKVGRKVQDESRERAEPIGSVVGLRRFSLLARIVGALVLSTPRYLWVFLWVNEMAGDWIKMRTDLLTSPKVVRISSALNADRFRIAGGLLSVWSLFDVHSADGVLHGYTVDSLDDLAAWSGFSAAMISVGWLIESDGNLELPRFEVHNGTSAKRRCQDADRKKTVRKLSASDADKMRTREEKRREEKIKPKNTCPQQADDGFDQFWKLYPNKKGKEPARKAWAKLKMTDDLFDLIADGLAKQVVCRDWTKDGGAFIPHPATWLNGRRWEDEVDDGRQDTRRSAGPVSLVDQVRERNRQREQERTGQTGTDDRFRTFDGEIVGADDEHVRPQMDLRTWP